MLPMSPSLESGTHEVEPVQCSESPIDWLSGKTNVAVLKFSAVFFVPFRNWQFTEQTSQIFRLIYVSFYTILPSYCGYAEI